MPIIGSVANQIIQVLFPTYVNVKSFGAQGDGVTDDTAAILAAIAYVLLLGGGIVYFPPGTYMTSASIVMSNDNVLLRGAGVASIIKPMANATFDVISSPIPIASGTAGFSHQYLGIESLKIDGANMTGTVDGQGNGVHWYGIRFGYVRDVYFVNMPNYCIIFDGDSTPNFGYNCEARGCTFDVCAGGVLYSGSEAHEFVQNKFKYAKLATAANQPKFNSPSTTAMHLLATGGYAYIAGNVFGNSGPYTSEAVRLANSGPCRVIGNRFDQCHAEAIRTTSGNHIIEGNQFGNPGSTVAGKSGILLGSSGNVVTGNKFDITNGAAAYQYCIAEPSAQSNNLIVGNSLVQGTSGFINLNAGSTGNVTAHNLGYNPVGKLASQPAIASSGVAVTNNSGVDCTVYIAGGTVSAVAIGGQATGLGASPGTYRVAAGQTITLTYTVPPTWVWFGD